DDAAARETAEAEGDVERDRAGGDDLDGLVPLLAEAHDRALTELPLDLDERGLKGLVPVAGPLDGRPAVRCHGNSLSGSLAISAAGFPLRCRCPTLFGTTDISGSPIRCCRSGGLRARTTHAPHCRRTTVRSASDTPISPAGPGCAILTGPSTGTRD